MSVVPFNDPITPRELGETLRLRRKVAGLTQQQAADKIGISVGTWGSWEDGVNLVKVAAFISAMEALGVRVTFHTVTPIKPDGRLLRG